MAYALEYRCDSVLLSLFCILSWLVLAYCDSLTNGTSNGTTSTKAPVLRANKKWETRTLINVTIVVLVVMVIVGGIFVIRYMRTERKKDSRRRYARLSKADEDDDDMELSIYEKN